MYRRSSPGQLSFENFYLPFGGKQSAENRWVKLTELIPWKEFEESYAKQFRKGMGAPAKSFRIALGALIIQERLGMSDAETVEQIRENPYLQYFKQAQLDAAIRNQVEDKFGVGKHRFSLGQVMAKFASTAETAIAITVLVMNLERLLWQLLVVFLSVVLQVLLQSHSGQRKWRAPQFSPMAA
jgi:Transposase DDE domain/Transposase domain (DUF772)